MCPLCLEVAYSDLAMAASSKAVHVALFYQKTHDAVVNEDNVALRDRIKVPNPPEEGENVRSSIRDAVKGSLQGSVKH